MKSKRLLCVLITLVFAVTLIFTAAACSKKDEEKTDSNQTAKPQKTQGVGEEKGLLPISDKKITIKFMLGNHPNYPIDNEAVTFQELMRRTNITIKYETVPNSDYGQKRNVVIASGSLPDIMTINAEEAKLHGSRGLFVEMGDLIKEHGANLTKLFTKEMLAQQMTVDKKLYSIPYYSEKIQQDGWLVRKDWLDKLGLEKPGTLDDFYDMLVEFRDKIPALTGKENIIPFGSRIGFRELRKNLSFVFDTRYAWKIENGKYVYTPVTDEYKEMLIFINKLYTEKLLNQEIMTDSVQQENEKIQSGLVGAIITKTNVPDVYAPAIQKKAPETEYVNMPPPAGLNGARGLKVRGYTLPGYSLAISSKSKHIEECFRLIDYSFSSEGITLLNYGVEGVTYDMKDGKPVLKEEVVESINSAANIANGLSKYGILPYLYPYYQTMDAQIQVGMVGKTFLESMEIIDTYKVFPLPSLPYTKEQSLKIKTIQASILTLREEYEAKFAMGILPFEQWDEYVEETEQLGLEEYVKLQNEAYEAYKELIK